MTCPTDDEFAALLEGTLSPERRRHLALHADTCEDCRSLLGTLLEPETDPGPPMIGRYQLLQRLGAGAMGVVHLAFDSRLERNVALKVLRNPDRPAERDRLLREAKTLARLSHPNVVAIYEVGRAEGVDFIAMEWVNGVNLQQWLFEQPRSQTDILRVFLEAGQGLAAAHRAGLVHRDFKPGNVLVGHDGRVRVGDFGLAKDLTAEEVRTTRAMSVRISTLTQTGAVLGTPAYMAPEQHRGEPTTAASDQFSFCVALYEALQQRRPFDGDSLEELYSSIQAQQFPPPASLERRQQAAICQGLALHPENRHPSMEPLLAAFTAKPQFPLRAFGLALSLTAALLVIAYCGGGWLTLGVLSALDDVGGPPRKEFYELRALSHDRVGTDPYWPRLERVFQRSEVALLKGRLGLYHMSGMRTRIHRSIRDSTLTLEEIEEIEREGF